jgi:hypothetical protein
LPGQSETVGGITISVTKTPVSKSTSPNDQRKRKEDVKQQVVRTVPTDDEDPDASPDPNKTSDEDLAEACRSGVHARVIPELGGGRVIVNGLPLEIKKRLAARAGLVERFTGHGNA